MQHQDASPSPRPSQGARFDPFAELGPLDRLLPERRLRSSWHRSQTTGPVQHAADIATHRPEPAKGVERIAAQHVLTHTLAAGDATGETPRDDVSFDDDGFHVRAQVRFAPGTSVYGLGEHAGPLLRNGRSHLLWNIDAYGYDARSRALYQSHPWALLLHADGTASGVLFETFRRGTIGCFQDGLEAVFEEEAFDVHIVRADGPHDVLSALAAMVGAPPRIPTWAFGYHQCRYSYMDAEEVRSVAQRLRAESIPCDAIWFDIDYMDRYRVFSWNHEAFPDPAALTAELRTGGIHSIAILDPGIVDDDEDPVRREAVEGDHLIAAPGTKHAGGRVWPGACHFPDFTRAATRDWWAERTREFIAKSGLDGVWCDMNEPALLGAPTRTLREDAVHRGDPGGSHARVHNLYGHLMVEATHAGATKACPGKRPFVLTRAGHLRTASLAATWTGDNQSHWDDLRWTIPMVLNLALSGQTLVGPDVGGFTGEADAELFVRWFELGAYLPFCRGHAEKGTPRKEPWSFGDEATGHVRAALRRRMELIPLLLTLADDASLKGRPIVRPVAFADPGDARLRSIDDAFLLGADLLVAPIVDADAEERDVVLPHGTWLEFPHAEARHAGGRTIRVKAPLGHTPVFVREGAVIPMTDAADSTSELSGDVTLHAFPGDSQVASGEFVLDQDGPAVLRWRCDVRPVRDGGSSPAPAANSTANSTANSAIDSATYSLTMSSIGHDEPASHATVRVHLPDGSATVITPS